VEILQCVRWSPQTQAFYRALHTWKFSNWPQNAVEIGADNETQDMSEGVFNEPTTVPLKCNVPLARAPQMRVLQHSTIKGAWHPPRSWVSIPWGMRSTLTIKMGATPPKRRLFTHSQSTHSRVRDVTFERYRTSSPGTQSSITSNSDIVVDDNDVQTSSNKLKSKKQN